MGAGDFICISATFFVPANKKGRAAKRTRETPHLPPRKGADVVLTSEWSWNEDS